jgi:molecular chaperone GrpE
LHVPLHRVTFEGRISPARSAALMSEENGYASELASDTASPTTDPVDAGDVGEDVVAETTERQLADQRDRYLRLAAEYDNFRKRTAKERQDAHLRGQGDLIKGMIDALDDLSRFAHVDPATTDARTISDGVSMVEKKLMKTLAGHGLEVIDPLGHPFDPAVHEAVMTEAAPSEDEDHLVARVFQQGYRFNGQLLRPARVVVKQWNG